MSARQCKINANRFCYICGELTFAKEKCSITSHIKNVYKAYFGCYLGDQDKSWALHVCCLTWVKTWSAWYPGKNVHMKFGVSRKITLMIAISIRMTLQTVLQQRKKTHCLPKFAISNAPSRALRKYTWAQSSRSRNAEFQQCR